MGIKWTQKSSDDWIIDTLNLLNDEQAIAKLQPKELDEKEKDSQIEKFRRRASRSLIKHVINAKNQGLTIPSDFSSYIIERFEEHFKNQDIEREENIKREIEKENGIEKEKIKILDDISHILSPTNNSDKDEEDDINARLITSLFIDGFINGRSDKKNKSKAKVSMSRYNIRFTGKISERYRTAYDYGYRISYEDEEQDLNKSLIQELLIEALNIGDTTAKKKIRECNLGSLIP